MKKNWYSIFLLIFVSSFILFFVFKPVLLKPDQFLYASSDDALKSYYNFAYYLKYNNGIKLDGINYPYGEHLMYDNTHPLHVAILKFVDQHICSVSEHAIGILNLTMIISLILALPFIFLILRKFALPSWYAFITSLIILFLSPQINRIGGHFEMVYAFFIPMFWYFIIRWKEGEKQWLWGSLLILAGLIGGFTSAYYAAIYSVFVLAVWLVEVWMHRRNFSGYWKQGLWLLLLAVIPVVVVKGTVSITDWVTDRPDNPWGFFIFHSNFYSIFLPPNSPLQSLLGKLTDMNFEWEGRAYVGLPATIYALIIGIGIITFIIRWKKVQWKQLFPNSQLNFYLAAAFIALLFSMCLPFNYGFRFLLDIIPPLKQFRALGRFAWIFYYIFTVSAAWFYYYTFRLFRKKKFYALAVTILLLALSYWSIDAGINMKKSVRRIFNPNVKLMPVDKNYDDMLQQNGIIKSDYQAILFLPLMNTCGDKLLFTRGMEAYGDAIQCSYRTGLPMIESLAPRISFTQALSSIQLVADSCIEKSRLTDMNDKPLLLIYLKDKLLPQESWITNHAQTLFINDKMTFASLSPAVFNESYRDWKNMADLSIRELDGYGANFTDVDTSQVIYSDFEDQKSKYSFTGKGAFFKKEGEAAILNAVLADTIVDEPVEISFWMYIDHRTYDMPKAVLKLRDSNNQQIESIKLETREVFNVYGKWARISTQIIPKPGITYQLTVRGEYITVDDVLVKPVHSHMFVKKTEGFSLFDNFPYNNN